MGRREKKTMGSPRGTDLPRASGGVGSGSLWLEPREHCRNYREVRLVVNVLEYLTKELKHYFFPVDK